MAAMPEHRCATCRQQFASYASLLEHVSQQHPTRQAEIDHGLARLKALLANAPSEAATAGSGRPVYHGNGTSQGHAGPSRDGFSPDGAAGRERRSRTLSRSVRNDAAPSLPIPATPPGAG